MILLFGSQEQKKYKSQFVTYFVGFSVSHMASKIFTCFQDHLKQKIVDKTRCKIPSGNHCQTTQKMKFSMKNFFRKCEQICKKLRIWSHLLKKSLIENFLFCAVPSVSYLVRGLFMQFGYFQRLSEFFDLFGKVYLINLKFP